MFLLVSRVSATFHSEIAYWMLTAMIVDADVFGILCMREKLQILFNRVCGRASIFSTRSLEAKPRTSSLERTQTFGQMH